MAKFTHKLQILKENTSSTEVKQFCTDMINTHLLTAEHELKGIVVESLKNMAGDAYSKDFVSRVENDVKSDNLGLTEAVKALQVVSVGDATFKYRRTIFESQVQAKMPQYILIENFLGAFTPYNYEPRVKAIVDQVAAVYEANKTDIMLKKTLWDISSSKNSFMFGKLSSQIQEFVETKNPSSRNLLIAEMDKYNFDSLNAAKFALKTSSINEGQMEVISTNSNCEIKSVISPVLFENGSQVFFDGNNFYKNANDTLTRLTNEDVQALPAKYLGVVEAFMNPIFKFTNATADFMMKKDKVSFNLDENKLYLNGKEIQGVQTLASTGMFQFAPKVGADLVTIVENRDLFFDMDFAKKVVSKTFENVGVTLFKVKDKLFVNKTNPGMNENTFTETSAVALSEMVKGFLNFNLDESLKGYLSAEKTQILEHTEEQKEITESINSLRDNLKKLATVKETNPLLSEQVSKMEKAISGEIENLQEEWAELESKKNSVVKIQEEEVSKVGFKSGDVVKIKGGGKGKVTSIDSNNQKIDVLLGDGTTKSYDLEQIESQEKEVEDKEKDNEEEADEVATDKPVENVKESLNEGLKEKLAKLKAGDDDDQRSNSNSLSHNGFEIRKFSKGYGAETLKKMDGGAGFNIFADEEELYKFLGEK